MTFLFKNNYIIHIRSNEVTQLTDGYNTNLRVALDTNSSNSFGYLYTVPTSPIQSTMSQKTL